MAEMDNAIDKLTEDMEQAQQKVSVVSAQLRRYTFHFSRAALNVVIVDCVGT
jgi:hypothetical protein